MKKTIYLSLLSLLAVSCYEEIIIPVGNDEPIGVMNAQLNTLDTTHTVFLSVTQKNEMLPLNNADIRVFINGTLAATAKEIYGLVYFDARNEMGYSFDAVFQPGDEVRIEARKGDISMNATVTAPQPVTLSSVDTSYVWMTYLGEANYYLQVKTVFQDLPGASFYRVTGRMLDEFEYQDKEMNPIPGYSGTVENRLWVETGFDPVISEGAGKTGAIDLGTLLAEENSLHCFSDLSFAGQECTIRPLFSPWGLEEYYYYSGQYVPDKMTEDYSTLDEYYRIIRRHAFVQLRTLDFSQYHYLKALENLETFGTELSFLVEPTTLPSNVEGGLGFVGIETVSEKEFYGLIIYSYPHVHEDDDE